MNNSTRPRRHFWVYIFIGVFVCAMLGMGSFAVVFSGWSESETATAEEATVTFDSVISELNDKRAYLTISDSGSVTVDRTLEASKQTKLAALHFANYEPESAQLSRVRFPFWFVRVKTTDQLNLGTLVAVLSQDWEQLDLSVTEEDLMRRGPGLVLDHTREDGARLLLWLE